MLQEKLQSWLVSRIGIVLAGPGRGGTGGMVDGREPHSPSAGCGRVRFLGGLHYRYQNDYKFQLSFRNCNSIHYMNCQVLA